LGKTKAVCAKFFHDVACQKLLKLANFSQSYSKNKSSPWCTLPAGQKAAEAALFPRCYTYHKPQGLAEIMAITESI